MPQSSRNLARRFDAASGGSAVVIGNSGPLMVLGRNGSTAAGLEQCAAADGVAFVSRKPVAEVGCLDYGRG
jgi:hypothetical protein